MIKIGVFDSGVGGEAVAERLRQLFPEAKIISVNDSANVPYGTKAAHEITRLTDSAIQPLLKAKCDAIVIACNTATTNAINHLRATYPKVHFVGIEPMVKPAAKLTKTSVIAVLATPSTLKSHRYAELKRQWAPKLTVIEPDCANWASFIERGELQRVDVHVAVHEALRWHSDVIVLGCTHYHWLKDRIQAIAGPSVRVLEPSDAIGARIESLLSTDSLLPV
ncbi:MAG: glutamate racemase [Candidatus Nomurabacteria bacterium]|nr:MAG: glutamate racemase [Candidatus Nomurabacteria bacterium]